MEVRHLTKLTITVVQIFLVSLAKELVSSTQTGQPFYSSHGINLENSVPEALDLENDKLLEIANEIRDGLIKFRERQDQLWNQKSEKDALAEAVLNKYKGNFKRKWSGLAAWGKRSFEDRDSDGKRSAGGPSRGSRKWPEFSSWGKRNDGSDRDVDTERQWKDWSMVAKRQRDEGEKWKAIAVWGKRETTGPNKGWKSLASWGKRMPGFSTSKKWKGVSAWGKREAPEAWKNVPWDKSRSDSFSKKWMEMAAWGKRSSGQVELKKRDDAGIWRKRTFRHIRNWNDVDVWAKRPSWGKTGFTSWGKRSADLVSSTFGNNHPVTGSGQAKIADNGVRHGQIFHVAKFHP